MARESVMVPGWLAQTVGVVMLGAALVTGYTADHEEWVRIEAEPEPARDGYIRPRVVWLPSGRLTEQDMTTTGFDYVGMCETEVTVAQYRTVTGQTPSDCRYGCDDEQPVQNVTWRDAIRYLNRLTQLENRARGRLRESLLSYCYEELTGTAVRGCTGYRLPTESEWELAARGLGDATRPSASQICTFGHVRGCDGDAGTIAVKRRSANAAGMYGMQGNVWEWVDVDDAHGGEPWRVPGIDDIYAIVRGGSFTDGPESSRLAQLRDIPAVNVGFRCAIVRPAESG